MCPILCELCTANKTAGYNFIPAPAVRLEAGSSKSEYFHTLINAPVTLTVANLRGREGRHPGVQILSILCSFWENFVQNRVLEPPPQGNPGYAIARLTHICYFLPMCEITFK